MTENKYKIIYFGLLIALTILFIQPIFVLTQSAIAADDEVVNMGGGVGDGESQAAADAAKQAEANAVGANITGSSQGSGSTWTGIVPCGNGDTPCTLCDLISGIKYLIDWGLGIVFSVAIVCIVIAGIMYIVSTGNEGMMTQAKSFLTVSLVGFFIVLGAWLIVNVTITWLLPSDISGSTGKANWYSFTGELNCGSNIGKPGGNSGSPSGTPSSQQPAN